MSLAVGGNKRGGVVGQSGGKTRGTVRNLRRCHGAVTRGVFHCGFGEWQEGIVWTVGWDTFTQGMGKEVRQPKVGSVQRRVVVWHPNFPYGLTNQAGRRIKDGTSLRFCLVVFWEDPWMMRVSPPRASSCTPLLCTFKHPQGHFFGVFLWGPAYNSPTVWHGWYDVPHGKGVIRWCGDLSLYRVWPEWTRQNGK